MLLINFVSSLTVQHIISPGQSDSPLFTGALFYCFSHHPVTCLSPSLLHLCANMCATLSTHSSCSSNFYAFTAIYSCGVDCSPSASIFSAESSFHKRAHENKQLAQTLVSHFLLAVHLLVSCDSETRYFQATQCCTQCPFTRHAVTMDCFRRRPHVRSPVPAAVATLSPRLDRLVTVFHTTALMLKYLW